MNEQDAINATPEKKSAFRSIQNNKSIKPQSDDRPRSIDSSEPPNSNEAPLEETEGICTQEDIAKLQKVRSAIPLAVWVVVCISFFERYAYNSIAGPFQNYIQNSSHDPLRPGALGLGQATASTIVNVFYMVSYATPMLAGIVTDVYLGRFKTVFLSYSIYILGVTILFITSLPTMLERGAGLPGLIVAMFIISFGLGAMKASIPPYVAEQCAAVKEEVRTTKNGERVFVSREATVEYAFNIYYWSSNLGTQSRIAATFIEKDRGFWATYLMALCSLCLGLALLFSCRTRLVEIKPQGSVLVRAGKAFSIAIRNGFKMNAAKVNAVLTRSGETVSWTDDFIEQLKSGLIACRVFLPFIIYWLCQAQMTTNTVSQAGNMKTYGVPNDLLPNLDSLTIVLVLPLVNRLLYPRLKRAGVAFSPIWRMAVGFAFESLGIAWAAGVQGWIYASPPCYSRPRACAASHNGALPNNLSVAVQLPIYIFEGFGEAFAVPAVYEYAFNKAPKSMRSIIQAVYVLCAAMGSLIGLALNPTYKDPSLLYMYVGLAAAMMAGMMLFLVAFHKQNRRDEDEKTRS